MIVTANKKLHEQGSDICELLMIEGRDGERFSINC